jgi:hypothetical protein
MANQMVRVPSSPLSPKPGQTFTVGSISWVINANGEGEIVEVVQFNPALGVIFLAESSLSSASSAKEIH